MKYTCRRNQLLGGRELIGGKNSRRLFILMGVVFLLFAFMEFSRGNGGKPVKFAYIIRSRDGKSYNDIYNEELIRYFSRYAGRRVEVVKGSYSELKWMKDIDVFIDFPGRRKDVKRIEEAKKMEYVLYVNEVLPVKEFESDKRIALFKGDNIFFRNIAKKYYTNEYHYVDSVEEGFQLLKEGKVDGFLALEDPIYMRNPERQHISEINVLGNYSYDKTLYLMNPKVEASVDKFLKRLKAQDKKFIEKSTKTKLIWSQINLSQEEFQYLRNKRIIRVGADFDRIAPLAYYENKRMMGSISEYMNLLRAGAGVQIEYVNRDSGEEIVQSLKDNTIDLDATHTSGRDGEGIVETSPYFSSVVGIFSLKDRVGENIEKVFKDSEEEVGAVGIKLSGPQGEYELVKDQETDGLYKLLREGEIDYFTHSYTLLKHPHNLQGIKDLRLFGVLDKKIAFTMAATEENKVIIDILDRMFRYLDHDEIRYRWEMNASSIEKRNTYKKFVFLFGVALVLLLPYILILKIEMEKIKKIERELQDTKENLENALNVKSAFLANMSHEMRTPLTAILGFNKLLIRKEEDLKKRHLMENIEVSAETLLEFINNVLDLSKLESGRIELKNKRINLYQMADDLERISLGLKRSDDVEFCFIITEDAPRYFMGDEVWLKEIILNLLGNAFKFTERGSVQLRLSRDKEELVIEVRDTGIGMKNFEQEGEKIFKRYEQLDLNENRDKKGSGLGLAIVREVVELMEGRIEVESVYKQGTTFRINLPIKKKLEIHGAIRGVKVQGGSNEREGA